MISNAERKLSFRVLLAAFSLSLFAIGCRTQSDSRGSGKENQDFAKHFISEAITYGARPISTNGLPELRIDWQEKTDEAGFQVKTHARHYKELSDFLRIAFGNPRMPEARTTDGLMAVYAAADIGVAIQVGTNADGAFIVLIRGMTTGELFQGGIR